MPAAGDAQAVVERAHEAGVRLVRFLWCGNDGTIRARASTLARLSSRLANGIGGTAWMQTMNIADAAQSVEGLESVGDVRLVPDLETFRIVPYAPHTAVVLGDHVFRGDHLQLGDYFRLTESPGPICQRTFLKRMHARLAERDATIRVGVETEFSLTRRGESRFIPVDRSLRYSTIGLTASQEYADELVAALDDQEIAVDQYSAGLGHGQQKISVLHRSALRAADDHLYLRETIRNVAARHGLVASLAPRPWLEQDVGNRLHLNFSLWSRDGHNRFHSPGAPDSLSGEARGFLAGVIEHLPGLIGLTAPSFNSFPQPWAGAIAGWSHGGRSLPLRVPAGGSGEASTHAEFTAADASCNPYLAIGGLIAAGVDGLVRGLLLPEAVGDDLAGRPFEDETAAEADTEDTAEPGADGEISRLPENQAEALDALEADEVLMEAMGSSLARSYLAVRRSEWELFSGKNTAFVERGYFNRY